MIYQKATLSINGEDCLLLDVGGGNGKIKRLTKQRDYWRKKFEETDLILRKYPALVKSYAHLYDLMKLKKELRSKDALIESLDCQIRMYEKNNEQI